MSLPSRCWVRAGRAAAQGEAKRSSKSVRALCYKQHDLAHLVFIACKCHKHKHPYAHVMASKNSFTMHEKGTQS